VIGQGCAPRFHPRRKELAEQHAQRLADESLDEDPGDDPDRDEQQKPKRCAGGQGKQRPGVRSIIASMGPLKAHVRGGRLLLDEPTDLPDGQDVELVPLDEVLASGGDYLDAEERQRLEESLDRGLEDVRAGRVVDAEQVIARLRARNAGR
jgi:hypothetical protein